MFDRLFKFFFRQQPDSSRPKFQAFILEPILTPSGMVDTGDDWCTPIDVEIEIDSDFVSDDFDGLERTESLLEDDLEEIPFMLPPHESITPAFESGYFTVGESGEVGIDFLFDSGKYKFELAIFSLEDLDETPGSEAFIREAARRSLSNSTEGYTVISDRLEGARFDGVLGEGKDWNSGDYLGVKTFQMEAGTQFGIMLVPNGSIEDVYENPQISGSKAPLFSLSTANPDDALHLGQIADVTGEGNTFVMEDVQEGHQWFDRDYNDLIFQVRGATGEAVELDEVIDPGQDWRETDMGQGILDYAAAYEGEAIAMPDLPDAPRENQPLIGIIDTGFSPNNPDFDTDIQTGRDWLDGDDNPFIEPGEGNEAGTHRMGIIAANSDNDLIVDGINDNAPLWLGRADAETWSNSLTEFVDTAIASEQPHAVVNVSFPFTDAEGNTRYELTSGERDAIAYARDNGIILVVAAGDDGGVMSALAQASQEFDNIITVGGSEGLERTDYSNFGRGLDILIEGGTEENPVISTLGDDAGTMAGTGVAASRLTGAVSQVWAANPELSYLQVIDILGKTARDIGTWGEDGETGAGLLNIAAAVNLAIATNASEYNVSEELEEIEYITGDGGESGDRPSPDPNYLPQNLRFIVDRFYNPLEIVSLQGKVKDYDGIDDLDRMEFFLQKDGEEWNKIGEATEFNDDPYNRDSFRFQRDLGQLAPGNYNLQTVAYDSSNIAWEMEAEEFTILSVPEGEELSDRVKASIERSLNLESYNPVALGQTKAWLVSVQAGQDVEAFAEELGAVNIGATGQIANTYRWEFPRDRSPQEVAEALKVKGIEFAYPLVPLDIIWHSPSDEPYVKDGTQWHLNSGNTYDANILKVWEDGILGNGSVIGFVDNGFELDDPGRFEGHPDLLANYLQDLSWDFVEQDAIASRGMGEIIRLDKMPKPILEWQIKYIGLNPIEAGFDWGAYNSPFVPKGHNYYGFKSDVDTTIDRLFVNIDLDHQKLQDIEVNLVSSQGTKIPITLDNEGSFAGYVSDFDGEQSLGKWILEVIDKNPDDGITGRLNEVVLKVNETERDHGTKVAGVAIANGDNNRWGTGVSPEANWAALRMGDKMYGWEVADILYDAFGYRNDGIDIYNNSWGFSFYEKPEQNSNHDQASLVEAAIEKGAKKGRDNLGNIYVFSAGNGAKIGSNVNYNLLANSRQGIAVAAIDANGKHSPYSDSGAPVLVSAYSNAGTQDSSDRPIATTGQYSDDGDDSNDYTISAYQDGDDQKDNLNDFGGTSAAAPFVSGVVALMLEANPDLTWRDVQHILVETAQKNDPTDSEWMQNKAGYSVNPKYGFGAVDAFAAVEMAKTWTTVGEEIPVSGEEMVSTWIPDYDPNLNNPQSLKSTITLTPTDEMNVEWVEVEFAGRHSYLGDLTLVLTSPDGTKSVLAKQHRSPDIATIYNNNKNLNWTYTSNQYWGESVTGDWTLEVIDEYDGNIYATYWTDWKINVYGTKKEPIPDNSWIRQMGTQGSDRASGVTVDDNGNVYVVGTTDGDLEGTNAGENDAFVTKYDVDGNLLWKEQIGTPGIDETRDIAVGKNGHIYITGHTFGNLIESNEGSSDVFFIELDADGKQLLKKQVGSSSDDYATGITVDDAGDIYLTGFTGGNLEGSNQGGYDPWVAKYNSSGEKQWEDQFATSSHEGAIDIAIDSLGNTYIVGHSYGKIGENNEGSQDAFIIKYSPSGNREWERQLGTSEYEEGHGIAIDSEDNIYIVGNTNGSIKGQNQGWSDVFVTKFNPQGDEQWKEQFGSTVQDSASRIAIDKNNIIYVTGVTNGTLNDRTPVGGQDAFVTRLNSSGEHLETQILGTTGDDLAQDVHIDRSGNIYLAGYTMGDLAAENAGDRDFWVSKNYIQPSVTITTNQTTVNEDGDPVSITISRTGSTDESLEVSLDLGGSAIAGDDYTLPDTVEIPEGESSITIKLTPIDDSVYEGDENISVNVSEGIGYKLGGENAIAFNLVDDETLTSVEIESVIPIVSEDGFAALFEITREGGNQNEALIVSFDISGTAIQGIDYQNFSNTVTIPAGKDSVFLFINPIEDNEYEGNETVVVNLTNGTGYEGGSNTNASVTILDNDPEPLSVVSLRATDNEASEDGNAAQFVVERTGDTSEDLTVHYSLAGEANNGEDYQELTGSVLIPAGATMAAIGVVPLHDYETEQNETVILNLTGDLGYDLGNETSATATILNSIRTSRYGSFIYVNPNNGHLYILSEKDTWLGAQEQAEALGGNLVTINDQTENDWLLDTFGDPSYKAPWIGLTDSSFYNAEEGDFKWINNESMNYENWMPYRPDNAPVHPDGENFGTINLSENDINVGLWNDLPADYVTQNSLGETGVFDISRTGIIEIDPTELDQPIVNFMVTDDEAGEDGNAGQIVVTRVGHLDEDLTVNYSLSGDATNGVDYEQLPETIVIPAGQSLATIPIIPVNDSLFEEQETVVLNLANGNYAIGTHGSGQVTLSDNDKGFAFDSFNASNVDKFNLIGDAVLVDDKLRINPAEGFKIGAIWNNTKQEINHGFETSFKFQVTDPKEGTISGDGFAFIIQNNNELAIGSGGGNKGYGGIAGSGIANSVAIEFDTYKNGGEANGNHISVQTNGTGHNTIDPDYSLGTATNIPNLADGNEHEVKVKYTPGNLEIFLDDLTDPVLVVPVDLDTTLNLDNGKAWLGFTGATGVAWQNNDILNWSFSSTETEAKPTIYTNPETGNKYFLTTPDTWLGAQEQAEAAGGNLVSINDANEQQWLSDNLGTSVAHWMGLTDSPIYGNQEGDFRWVNGEDASYTNWHPLEPNNAIYYAEGEDFTNLNHDTNSYPNDGLWNDLAHNSIRTGIVEIAAKAGYNWLWTYFGEDFNPNGNDAPLTNTPNSDKARNEFLANLENIKIENLESYADASVPTTLKFGDETATVSGIRSIRDFSTGGYNGDGTYPISGDKYMFHYAGSKTIKIDFENPQSAFGFSTTDAGDGGSQVIVTLHREDGSTEDLIVPHGQGGINWGEATFFGVTDLENPFVAVTLTNTNYEHDGFGIDDLIIGDIKPETILNTATPPNQTLHLAYREDTPLNLSDILVTDPDGEATVKLTLSRPTEGSLTPATSGNVTSTYDPVTGVWQASGEIADINRLLADLHFTPRDNAHGTLDIATEITVGNSTHTGTIALTGIPVNDRPTLTAIAPFSGAKEGQPFTLTYEDLLAASDAKDIENSAIALQILSPSNGTLTRNGIPVASGTPLNPGETLVWIPDTSGDRIPAFRVKAFDGELYSDTEVEVAIAVSPNDSPTLQVEPTQQWVQQLGSNSFDGLGDVATDSEGNVFLAGWVRGDIDGNTYQGGPGAPGSTGDGVLTKYDREGNKLWTKTLGSTEDEGFAGVATDSQGNAYVVGHTFGALNNHQNLGKTDGFIGKYDPDGNLIWSKHIGTGEDDLLTNVIVDRDDNFYTVGATLGFMEGTDRHFGNDTLIQKWDSNGNLLWTKQFTSIDPSTSTGKDIVLDEKTGDLLIAGNVAGNLDGQTSSGSYDIMVARYDRDGNAIWERQFGTTGWDEAVAIDTDSDGNIYVSGVVQEALEGETYEGSRDAFAAKLDKDGNLIWTEQIAQNGNTDPNYQGDDFAYGIGVDANDQIYVTGHIDGSLDGNEHAGSHDAFVTGLDTDGNRNWSQQFGFPGWDILHQIDFDTDNNMFVAGAVTGAMPGQTDAGSMDLIVAKYNHTQTYFANTPFDLNGIYINDTEGDRVTVTLTLSDANAGTLTSTTTNDASTDFSNGVLTVEGSTEDVNAVLQDLQFKPATDYTETVTIATSVSDPYSDPVTGATMTLESDITTPIKVGEEFQVNTYTNRGQSFSTVATLVNGDFVVTWESEDQDNSDSGIYAQRYDQQGNPLGQEFKVNSYPKGLKTEPAITGISDGGFMISWTSEGQDNSDSGIYAQRYDQQGNPVGQEFKVNSYSESEQRHPTITSLGEEGFVIAWSSRQDGSSYGIYAQRYDDQGNPIGSEFQVNSYTEDGQFSPSITTLKDGGFMITWFSYVQDIGWFGKIAAQRYDKYGQAIGSEIKIADSNEFLNDIITLKDGGFVITWMGHETFARHYDKHGNLVGEIKRSNTMHEAPSVTALDDGGFILTWTSYGQGYNIELYAQRYNSSGQEIGETFRVNTYSPNIQTASDVTTLSDGQFVVTWMSQGQDSDNWGIYGQRFTV